GTRLPQLHSARAGARGLPSRRAGERCLFARRDPISVAYGPPTVYGGNADANVAVGGRNRAGVPAAAESDLAAGFGDNLPQVPPERSATALRHGAGIGGRPGSFFARRADPRPTGNHARAGLALVPAASRARSPGHRRAGAVADSGRGFNPLRLAPE